MGHTAQSSRTNGPSPPNEGLLASEPLVWGLFFAVQTSLGCRRCWQHPWPLPSKHSTVPTTAAYRHCWVSPWGTPILNLLVELYLPLTENAVKSPPSLRLPPLLSSLPLSSFSMEIRTHALSDSFLLLTSEQGFDGNLELLQLLGEVSV